MTIAISNKFNSGNGGAIVTITKDGGHLGMGGVESTEEICEFISAQRAREIALDLLRNHVKGSTFEAIEKLLAADPLHGRVVLPVKVK